MVILSGAVFKFKFGKSSYYHLIRDVARLDSAKQDFLYTPLIGLYIQILVEGVHILDLVATRGCG